MAWILPACQHGHFRGTTGRSARERTDGINGARTRSVRFENSSTNDTVAIVKGGASFSALPKFTIMCESLIINPISYAECRYSEQLVDEAQDTNEQKKTSPPNWGDRGGPPDRCKPPRQRSGSPNALDNTGALIAIVCHSGVLFLPLHKASSLPGAVVRWGWREHLIMMAAHLYACLHLSHHLFPHLWRVHPRGSSNTPYPRTPSPQWKFWQNG